MRNFLGGLIIGLLFAAVVEQEERITELEVTVKLLLNSAYGKLLPDHTHYSEGGLRAGHVNVNAT